jgi:serine protease Do
MTTKSVWAVALLAAGAAAPATWAQNPTPRAHTATIVMAGGTYLGVGVVDVDSERARTLKLKEDRGVEITSVTEGGPADKAGIKQGDVVLEYNGQAVDGMTQFQRLVRETPASRQVKIGLWRNGAPLTLTATVETRKSMSIESPDLDINVFGNSPTFEMTPMPSMQPFDMPHIMTLMPSRRLGIEGEGLGEEPQFAEFLGVKDGVLVKSVVKNSAAEKAGIKAGDVITKIGDTHVGSSRDITSTLHANHQNQTFVVTVVRNKKEMQVTVTIEDRTGQNVTNAMAHC